MLRPRFPEYYRERSEHFLRRVDGELDAGEVEVACEMLWGAAAHAIKSIAQERGWPHTEHRLLRVAVDRLISGGAPRYLLGQYLMASDLHQGFYGDRIFDADQIRRAKEPITEFISALHSLS